MHRSFLKVLSLLGILIALSLPGFSQMLRERVAENLERTHNAMDEGDMVLALDIIQRLANYALNPYERAVVMQNKGYVHLNREEPRPAIEAFEEAYTLQELPDEMNINMLYMLAQLYANVERWVECLDRLELWLPTQDAPTRIAYTLGAQASAELNMLDKAIDYTKKAINAEAEPPENLFRLWMALHFQKGELREAAKVLEKTIVHFDKQEYWRNLGMIYLSLQDDPRAASINYIAYNRGFIEKPEDILNLVRLLMFTEQPFEAGEVLLDALEKGRVPRTTDNWELLGSAWWAARESDRSLAALNEAAALSPKSELDVRVAQIYIDKEMWEPAIEHLLAAETKGVKQPGMMYQLLGYAYYGLEDFVNAKGAFVKAGNVSQELEDTVSMWMTHLDEEISRREQLKALEEGAREVIIEEIPET